MTQKQPDVGEGVMSSGAPLTAEELRAEVRALRSDLEALGSFLADAVMLVAPGNPALAEALAQAAGIDPAGREDAEGAAEVPAHVLSSIRRAYQSCTAPLRLSSEVIERLGRAAERWNRTRPESFAAIEWEDMARLAIAGLLALEERGSGEHEAGAEG